jgi:chaperonin GroES
MTAHNVKPLADRLLVKRIKQEDKTKGGIIIPDNAQEKPQEGLVIAAGNGAKTEDGKVIPMDVKVGDTVLFAKWGGTEIKLENEEYLIMKESDVLAVVNNK